MATAKVVPNFDVGKKKMKQWLLSVSTWDKLNSLGTSKALKSSYIWFVSVPIAATFLSQLNVPIEVTFWGRTHQFDLTLPFNWILFYFASIVFSLASIIFTLRCPDLIKRYKTFSHYYQDGNGSALVGDTITESSELINHDENLEMLRSRINAAMIKGNINNETIKTIEDIALVRFAPRAILLIPREELGDLFSFVSTVAGKLYPKTRVFLIGMYSIGFLLIGIVLFQNLLSVISRI